MGQYEPNDSRDVTLNNNSAPGEPPRTGPREEQTRAQDDGGKDDAEQRREQARAQEQEQGRSQSGYGNARGPDGKMEQDVARGDAEASDENGQKGEDRDPVVGETSPRPDVRARADANRPL